MEWKQIDRSGQPLFYKDSDPDGSSGKPAALMLHSFLCNSEYQWGPILDQVAETHRVIAVDMRGHGKSSPLLKEVHNIYELMDDAIAVLDHEKIEKAIWIGLSIGGMMSMRAGFCRKEKVAGLVLLNTSAEDESIFNSLKYRAMGTTIKLFGWGVLKQSVTELMFSPKRMLSPEERKAFSDMLDSQDPGSINMLLPVLTTRHNVSEFLKDISVPTMVIHGQFDQSLPLIDGKKLADTIPHAKWVPVQGAGHLSAVEAPEEVGGLICDFINNLPELPPPPPASKKEEEEKSDAASASSSSAPATT